MIKVAEMVCVIRHKFDEEKFFTILDLYKVAFQIRNSFVKDVNDFYISTIVAKITLADDQSFI